MLLDDFNSGDGVSFLGTPWEGFTDRVMGGVSNMQTGYGVENDIKFVRVTGKVSTQNNGGFIQIRLLFDKNKKPFDASDYQGLKLTVKGKGEGYYIHLRTTRTLFPWSYYAQALPVTDAWQEVYLPWISFFPEGMNPAALKTDKLISFAIVAAKKDFIADIQISRVELY